MAELAWIGSRDSFESNLANTANVMYGGWGGVFPQQLTELDAQLKVKGACTLKKMQVRVRTNNSTTVTFRDRKNGANGSLAVSVTGSTTGTFSDNSNSTSYSSGDLWNYQCPLTSGGGIDGTISAAIETSGQVFTHLTVGCISGSIFPSVTRYIAFDSPDKFFATAENDQKMVAVESATFSGLQMRVSTNDQTSTTTVRLRKNGANGNQVLSIGSGATGLFEDTTNSDTVAAGDTFNGSIVTGAGSGVTGLVPTAISVKYVSGAANKSILKAFRHNQASFSGSTRYGGFFGYAISFSSTTEAPGQIVAPVDGKVSNLRVQILTNSRNGAGTFTLRKNGADGTVSASITASTTGAFTDVTHEDSFAAGDLIGTKYVPGGSTGSIVFAGVTALLDTNTTVAITSASVTTASPAISASDLGVIRVLTSTNVATSAPAITQSTAGHIHVLTSATVATSAPAISNSAIGVIRVLTSTNVATAAPEITQATLGVIRVIASTDVATSAPAISQSDLGVIRVLTSTTVETSAPAISLSTLAQLHILTAQDVAAGTPEISVSVLGRINNLVSLDVSTSAPTISQSDAVVIRVLVSIDVVTAPPTISISDLVRIVAFTSVELSTGPPEISLSVMVEGPPRARLDDRIISLGGDLIPSRTVDPEGGLISTRFAAITSPTIQERQA